MFIFSFSCNAVSTQSVSQITFSNYNINENKKDEPMIKSKVSVGMSMTIEIRSSFSDLKERRQYK